MRRYSASLRSRLRSAEFAADRRRERNEAEYRRMRAHYEVVVEKPAPRSAN